MNRREFNGYGMALGLSLPAIGAVTAALSSASALAGDAASQNPERTVKLHDGPIVPALGQGSAHLG